MPCPPWPMIETSVQTSSGPVLLGQECTTPVVVNVVGSLKASGEEEDNMAGRRPDAGSGVRREKSSKYRRWMNGIARCRSAGVVMLRKRRCAPHGESGVG